jgi:hypothetical protein
VPTILVGCCQRQFGVNFYYQYCITIFVPVILHCPFAETTERNTITSIIKLTPSSSRCLVQQVSTTFHRFTLLSHYPSFFSEILFYNKSALRYDMIQLLAASRETQNLVLCRYVCWPVLQNKGQNLEWKAHNLVDTVVPTNSEPTSKYEQHLVDFVIVSYLVCWYKCS